MKNRNNGYGLGHHCSEETKKRMSNSAYIAQNRPDVKEKNRLWKLGKHWFTDGKRNILSNKCPDGWRPGFIKHKRNVNNKEQI